jgi:hypothetical protein
MAITKKPAAKVKKLVPELAAEKQPQRFFWASVKPDFDPYFDGGDLKESYASAADDFIEAEGPGTEPFYVVEYAPFKVTKVVQASAVKVLKEYSL